MTTYSAEVNIYNPEAIADAVDEAGETASTYITEVTGGGIQVHPASNTNDYTQIDANGVKLYKGGVQVAEFGTNVNFYDGQGSAASNVVAQFGGSGAQIGKSGAAHSVIDANGQRFYAGDGTTQLANIGYGEGAAESGTATRPYYTFGVRTGDSIGNYSLVEGNMNTSSGYSSHAEGYKTSAISSASHAQNYGTNAYMYAQTAIGAWNETESTLVTKSGTVQYAAISEVDIYYAQDVTAVRVDGTELTRGVDYNVLGAGYISIYNNKPHVSVRFPPDGAVPVGSTWEIDYIEQKYIFVIGNGSSNNNRSNAFAVDWDGYIYRNNETAHIGSIFTNSASNLRRTGTNIDSLMIGTSVSLPPGTYVITAYWTFNTGTSGATSRNLEVAIGSGTSNAWNFTRTNCYSYGYQRLTTYCIRAITQTTTVYVMGSGSQATNASYLDNAGIQAVKIV